MRGLFGSIVLAAIVITAVHAAQSDTRAGFEVASVKPNPSGSITLPDGRIANGASIASANGRFSAQNTSLLTLASLAYGLPEFRISGGPRWLRSDKFNVEAKAERPVDERALMRMLRSLLVERFQMTARLETKEMPAHVLLLGKKGPRVRPLDESQTAGEPQPRLRYAPMPAGADGARRNRLTGVASMDQLAAFLSASLRGPIVNETGLDGTFAINVEWTSETFAMSMKGGEREAAAGGAADLRPVDPDLAAAIEEQLGLTFETRRRPIETLVIESAQLPTAN